MEEKDEKVKEENMGINFDYDGPAIPMIEKDNSPEAKQKALKKLLSTKIWWLTDIKEFERRVHYLFDLVFEEFDTYCMYDRCFEKYGIDDELMIQPDFSKFNAQELLYILDSICHIDRRNEYLLMKHLIRAKYIQHLMLELKKKKDHLFDEVDEDFFERG